MIVKVICIDKTSDNYLQEGCRIFENRLKHYCKLHWQELPTPKKWNKLPVDMVKQLEGELILKNKTSNEFYLLDENGKEFTSRKLAKFFESHRLNATQELNFVIGGAFGFSDEVYAQAKGKIALSKLTFSHQMVRLFWLEQIYRAHTIMNNEKYHND